MMGKVNPINYQFNLKKGDTGIPIKMHLYDGDSCTDFSLAGYTVKFYMAPKNDPTTPKIDGIAGTIVDAASGVIQYQWQGTDTDTEGVFEFLFKLTNTISGRTFSVPIISPGIVVIEHTLGS